ncbi:MAG: DNA polymerase III subunit beta [Pyrinomonadaceae bacterium]
MEFNVSTATLEKELAFVQGVAERKATKNATPVLRNLKLEAGEPGTLRIIGSDRTTTLITVFEADVVKPGSALVNAEKFFGLSKQLPKGTVNVQREKNDRVKFKLEEITCRLVGDPVDSYPAVPEPQTPTVEINAEILRTMIHFVLFARTEEESRFDLSCIKLVIDSKAAMMVASNGHRLSVVKNSTIKSKEKVSTLVPGSALQELAKLAAAHEGTVGLKTDDNHAYFTVGHRTLITTLTAGQFPNFKQVLPQHNNMLMKVNAAALLESIRRVGLVATDEHHRVVFSLKGKTLDISANAGSHGDAHERLTVKEYDGEPIEIGFNVKYLADYLAVVGGADLTVKFKDDSTQVEFSPTLTPDTENRYVLCPVRK